MSPYWNVEHLLRTRDWIVELGAGDDEAMRIAALTHDIERHFPGGPQASLDDPPDDVPYRDAHQRRSAEIVSSWLREQGAEEALVADVEKLILVHEWGGELRGDLLQAADSLSFLEVNDALVERWVCEGRCSAERGAEQHHWMFERIRHVRARELAQPLYAHAVGRLGVPIR